MEPQVSDGRGALEQKKADADEVFGEAFDQAESAEKKDLSTADDPKNVPAGPEPEPVKPPEPAAEKKEEAAPAAPAPAAAPKEDEETYKQRYSTLQGIFKHDKESWEVDKAKLLAELEEAKKPKDPAPAEIKKEAVVSQALYDSLTEDQKAELRQYDEEFDTVSKMEGLKRKMELEKLRKEFQSFKDEIAAQLVPATTLVKTTQEEKEEREKEEHFSAIRTAHKDYEQYRDDNSIVKWIESKPRYMQKSMIETYNAGAAEDVVELLNDFKKENNIPLTPSDTPTNVISIDKKAEKKLAMTAVTTRRGAVNPSMAVANDFESAFDEALNKQGGK